MKIRAGFYFITIGVFHLVAAAVVAETSDTLPFISEVEFRTAAESASRKVNLFRDVWAQDAKARFYGGTSRDFLYWVKRQLAGARTLDQAKSKLKKLEQLPAIDVREFIVHASDIDLISDKVQVDSNAYGVRKIDLLSPSLRDGKSSVNQDERDQGFIPVEKIQLGQDGFHQFHGNGVTEIFQGKISVTFSEPEVFNNTRYAREGSNHPILLALRFLRQQAQLYFNQHGPGYPKDKRLFDIDPESEQKVKAIIESATESAAIAEMFKNPRFKTWFNKTIQTAFRSYTNPTAAMKLYEHFGADRLVQRFSGDVEPINQYLFERPPPPSPTTYQDRLKNLGYAEHELLIPVEKAFPGGKAYHGTRTDPAFWNIVRQGVLPSDSGLAGGGLYVVDETNRSFSENWGGAKERLVEFSVPPTARIVDIRDGIGAEAFRKSKMSESQFAEHFGIDILQYPYGGVSAFVVKNSAAITNPQGVYRKFARFSELVVTAQQVDSAESLKSLVESISNSHLTSHEHALIIKEIPVIKNSKLVRTVEQTWSGRANAGWYGPATTVLLLNELARFFPETEPSLIPLLEPSILSLATQLGKISKWQRTQAAQDLAHILSESGTGETRDLVTSRIYNERSKMPATSSMLSRLFLSRFYNFLSWGGAGAIGLALGTALVWGNTNLKSSVDKGYIAVSVASAFAIIPIMLRTLHGVKSENIVSTSKAKLALGRGLDALEKSCRATFKTITP